jgi:hypothetical protein
MSLPSTFQLGAMCSGVSHSSGTRHSPFFVEMLAAFAGAAAQSVANFHP